jgi:hypothetical protein
VLAESGDADLVATQEITARFSGSAQIQRRHVQGGGLLFGVGAPGGGPKDGRRARATPGQPAPLPSQSASEGNPPEPRAGNPRSGAELLHPLRTDLSG